MLSRLLVAAASLALLSFGPAKAGPAEPEKSEQAQAAAPQAPVTPTIIAKAEDAAPAAETAPAAAEAPATEAAPADTAAPAAEEAGSEKAAATEPEKPAAPAQPTMTANIDLTSQTITIAENGVVQHTWAISSGTRSHATPRGTFRPQWTAKMWYSRKYDNAPMPHAVFIHGGVAIHATYATGMLGRPASHGCIRLHPKNAKTFYNLVQRHGLKNVRVSIHGTPNWGAAPQVASRKTKQRVAAMQQQQSGGWDWFGLAQPVQKPVIVGKKRKGNKVYYYASNGNVYAAQAGSNKVKKVSGGY